MTVGSSVPEVCRRTFTGTTASIRDARIFVRNATSDVVSNAELIGDLELAVSELVTNAVEYGLQEPVTVTVVASTHSIVLSVGSVRTSSEIAHPTMWAGPLPAMRTGRGLAIVRALSDDVSVDADDATVTVHCTFHFR